MGHNMEDKREIFNITIISEAGTVAIHASHTGPRSTAFEAGMALVSQLAGTDSIEETVHAAHLVAPAWVQ